MLDSPDLPRGIRNNNAGNIRISSIPWRGKKEPNTDGVYEQFIESADGLHAIKRNLSSYKDIHNINTLRQLAERWAPNSENNTEAYINVLVREVGIGPDEYIDLEGFLLPKVVSGIVKNENGTNFGLSWYTLSFIEAS